MPSRMVGASASVNLPLHHKVQKFSSGTGSPELSRKRAVKRLWWVWWWFQRGNRSKRPLVACVCHSVVGYRLQLCTFNARNMVVGGKRNFCDESDYVDP